MPEPTLLVQGFVKPVAMRVVPGNERVIVAQKNGRLLSVDLSAPQIVQAGMVPGMTNTFDLSEDGKTLFAAGDGMGVWRKSLSGGTSGRVIRGINRPSAVLVRSNTLLASEGGLRGRLFSITLTPPISSAVRGRSLNNVRGMVQDPANDRLLAVEAFDGGLLVAIQRSPSPAVLPTVLLGGLGTPVDLDWLDEGSGLLLVADAAGKRLLQVDLSQPANPPVELLSGLEGLWAARAFTTRKILIGAGTALLAYEIPAAEPPKPIEISFPEGELFIGGWVRVSIQINDPAIAFDNLDFIVEPQEAAALVSPSRDNSFDPLNPHIVLTAGWMPGTHQLILVHRLDGQLLAKVDFEVLDNWTDPKFGPSLATFGSIQSGPDSGTWGGSDSGDFRVPQNVSVHPALGTRNVGVVLVDTMSARYPTGAALTTIINNLRNEMVNGVMVGGQNRSVAAYYNQASGNLFNINLVGILDPVQLPNNWNSYFFFNTDNTWVANNDLPATIIAEIVRRNEAAAQAGNPPALDLSQMDSLIYVVRSVPRTPPDADLFVWPRASFSTDTQVIGRIRAGFISVPVYRGIARLFMPDDWATRDGTRAFHETASHELGHNLGLIDQYDQTSFSADAKARLIGSNTGWSWELMAWEQNLPLPSASHRLQLGWLKPEWVRLYNFGVFGAIDETITLHAASLGKPPAGRFAAAEVRLEDGKNFYFEYRPAVTGRIVDPNPPEANTVLGSEALFRDPAPKDRAQILRVREDADAVIDQGAFASGEDYRDKDTTTPGFSADFIVDVVSTTSDSARVRVRYATDLKPDPALTPWSPRSNWQSPDIEVRNARSQADANFRNIPWEGHANTILARVTNRGSSPARGVKVDFFAKDFTFGSGNEQPLGSQTLDIPVGPLPVTFTAPQAWIPPTLQFIFGGITYEQHSCLVARIAPFLDPVSNILEVTPENNEAQSNYVWMASTTSSPASREATVVIAENPFDKPAVVYFTVNQPHPLFRVYLDHRWVRLDPGEKQPILVMTESLLGSEQFQELSGQFDPMEGRIASTLRLTALGDTFATCTAAVIGGVAILTRTGIATRFERFERDLNIIVGVIVRADNGAPVDGPVLVSILSQDQNDGRPEMIRQATAQEGRFIVEIGDVDRVLVQGHYLGEGPYSPCDSKVLEI